MPAPTMMTSSSMVPPAARLRARLAADTIDWSAHCQSGELLSLHKAHAHSPRARSLAGEPFCAAPIAKTGVIGGGFAHQAVTMRAPAVAVLAAGKLFRTAQLRPGGKAPRIVGRPGLAQRGQDVAAAGLIPKEMRRCRDHRGIG